MPVYTEQNPDTPRNRGNYDAPHVSPVTPAEDFRTVLLNRISWGPVFSGVAITLVCQLAFNLLGYGLGVVTTEDGTFATAAGAVYTVPVLTTAALLWCAIVGIVAVYIGGYAAGRLSGEPQESTAGWHGLTAWASSVIVAIMLAFAGGSMMMGGAVNAAASMIGPASTFSTMTSNAANGAATRTTPPAESAANTVGPTAPGSANAAPLPGEGTGATVSDVRSAAMRDAWISCIALFLSAIAAWFGGRSGAVEPTITSRNIRQQPLH
jgi:hypothetical protein